MKYLLRNEVIIIIVLGILFFLPFLGAVHLFDWDEINFAECSREMMVLHDYSRIYIDFKPFWEKPPLFFWMQSTSMWIFGVTAFAARFPNAVCGVVTILFLFLSGTRIFDRKFGLFWALAYGGSIFPFLYFKSGIIDPWFNLFIFVSFYFFICFHWKRNGLEAAGLLRSKMVYLCASALFMGLAIMTKGPVAILIFGLVCCAYLIRNRGRFFFNIKEVVIFILVGCLVVLPWYGYETLKNGPWFITEFIRYQVRLFTTHDAGQSGFPGYHFVVILFGCFPASVFAIPAFFKNNYNTRSEKDIKIWMLILFWVVMILFTIVKSRIIHYSSLAWFPVSFLAAYSIYKWDRKEKEVPAYIQYLLAGVGGIILLCLLVLPVMAPHISRFVSYVRDPFAKAAMAAEVQWSGWEWVTGMVMLFILNMGLIKLKKKRLITASWIFFGGMALVIFFASAILIPKVERYSQGAAIDFFIEHQGEDCYVRTLGYKSYGDLFYSQKGKPTNEKSYDIDWLLTGDIDKPVYFVTKITKAEKYASYKDVKELYRKNGFVFLKREIP